VASLIEDEKVHGSRGWSTKCHAIVGAYGLMSLLGNLL